MLSNKLFWVASNKECLNTAERSVQVIRVYLWQKFLLSFAGPGDQIT